MNRPIKREWINPFTGEVREVANYLTQEECSRIRKDKSDMFLQTATEQIPLFYVSDMYGFYGKAKVYTDWHDGLFLRSYDTIVCALIINPQTGEQTFQRYWDEWSRTTSNHVNAFLQANGWRAIDKKKWMSMPLYTDMIYGEVNR